MDAEGVFKLNTHPKVFHCMGVEGSTIGKVIGSWILKDLSTTNREGSSAPGEDAEYHQTRLMTIDLLHQIRVRLSLPDDQPWKLTVLRVLLASMDTKAISSGMGQIFHFKTEVLSIDDGLAIFYKLVLEDNDAFHLMKCQSKNAGSEAKGPSEGMKTFVTGVQELMSFGTPKEKDHIKTGELGEDLERLISYKQQFIRRALQSFVIFAAVYSEKMSALL